MVTCAKCGITKSSQVEWDDYGGQCFPCSYEEHVKESTQKAASNVSKAMDTLHTIRRKKAYAEWYSPGLAGAALETFVAATDAAAGNSRHPLSGAERHAAELALSLVRLVMLGAPVPVLENQCRVIEKAIARF